MNKSLWLNPIYNSQCPPWPCPTCGKGVLVLEGDSFKQANTEASMKHHQEDWWDHDSIVMSFTAWASCSNDACEERVALAGEGSVFTYPDDEGNTEYAEEFSLRYAHPSLQIINVPPNTPAEVRSALMSSFTLFWVDKAATASRIRTAVERLLDHLGIPARKELGGFIPLDNRIDLFSRRDAGVAQHLMALKWLGNAGSHAREMNAADILDAYSVVEYVLAELIENRSESVKRVSEALVAKYSVKPKF